MKQLLSILLLLPVLSFAQIQVKETVTKENLVGEAKEFGVVRGKLTYKITDSNDTLYTFMYQNAKYETLVDYKGLIFYGNESLEGLYNILMSVFADENKKNKDYKVSFKLGKTDVIVSNYRTMGVTSAMIFTDEGYTFFSEKQVKKIFGK